GATHLAHLDVTLDGQVVQCHHLDYGTGGLFAHLRAQIYSELGLPAPPVAAAPPAASGRPAQVAAALTGSALFEQVREVLRNFQVPQALARSLLAQGATVTERADYVRRLVRQSASEAFGASDTEKLLRNVLVAGYLEPVSSHEAAAARLCLSRAAYFRRLRTATERLAEHIAATICTPRSGGSDVQAAVPPG
ncbi:MAG TPA: hypothetical protein VF834_17820, partial [Streptosporangiaceae bacterium]